MKKNFVLGVLCLFLASCSPVTVKRDFDPGYDFSRLSLYTLEKQSVHSENARKVDNNLLDRRIESAIRRDLGSKGFSEVASGGNMTVRYGYYVKTVIASQPASTSMAYGWGRRGGYSGVGIHSGGSVQQYDKSFIVVDIVDSQTGDLIWRGNGSRRSLSYNDSPEKSDAAVNEAVIEILSNFPPQSK